MRLTELDLLDIPLRKAEARGTKPELETIHISDDLVREINGSGISTDLEHLRGKARSCIAMGWLDTVGINAQDQMRLTSAGCLQARNAKAAREEAAATGMAERISAYVQRRSGLFILLSNAIALLALAHSILAE